MARAAVPGRLGRRLAWRAATLTERRAETASAVTLAFDVPEWPGHLAGQHVDVRLTAEDGYRAQRSYSVASAPGGDLVELTVQRVDGGEVSPYLVDVLEPGDEVELRGPVGGWFVWRPEATSPVLLLAGGSGIVPLMAMIRTRRAAGSAVPFRLGYSLRTPADLIYRDELARPGPGLDVTYVYTRATPPGSARAAGRLTRADLAAVPPADCFVCGPTGFVEAAADLLVDLGHDPGRIKTERFGPTGG
ncbi:MAG TPA: ferredoxin reductase [Actinophytocola sp.]|uniref:ferredoxin reductase n=1 Tax=Actinophytocola sp. TaxID=1872138 RepID=UPI002F941681